MTTLSEMESLIAKQSLKIHSVECENNKLLSAIEKATSIMTCIGGPLNDNKLGYNAKQLTVIQGIYYELMI